VNPVGTMSVSIRDMGFVPIVAPNYSGATIIISLDETDLLQVKGHVFTSEKGDYYEVPEDHLQYSQWCREGEI